MRARRGFTLWELSIVFALMAIGAALVIPNWVNMSEPEPYVPGNALVALLRDARRVAINQSQYVAVRVDPSNGYYQVDTTGVAGTGVYVEGTLELSGSEKLDTDLPRLQFLFRPTGTALGDSVTVRGDQNVVVMLDVWSGQPQVYAR